MPASTFAQWASTFANGQQMEVSPAPCASTPAWDESDAKMASRAIDRLSGAADETAERAGQPPKNAVGSYSANRCTLFIAPRGVRRLVALVYALCHPQAIELTVSPVRTRAMSPVGRAQSQHL